MRNQHARLQDILSQAFAQHQAGRLDEAARLYQQILDTEPGQFDALHFSGVLALQQGDAISAAKRLQTAVDVRPDSVDARCNLGLALLTLGEPQQAIPHFEQVLQIEPNLAPARNGLARAHLDAGHPDEARLHAQRAVDMLPDNPTAWRILAEVDSRLRAFDHAVDHYRRAAALAPWDPELLYNLATTLEESGRWSEARDAYIKTLEVDAELDPALANLVFIKRSLCDWDGLATLEKRLIARIERGANNIGPFLMLAVSDDRALQRRCARAFSNQYRSSNTPFEHISAGNERLTIGYLSSGYRRYPTATLIPGVIEQHDRSRFRVLGLSTGTDDASDERKRLKGAFDEWLELRSLPATEAARRIRAAGVDILVDLKGHSDEAPTAITALRPAPLQVCWVGYPGTTGADFIDYLIADHTVIPATHDDGYSEAVVRLGTCYQPNDSHRLLPQAKLTRADCSLPHDKAVFCCFNHLYKLDEITFCKWLEILNASPECVLWLLEPKADEGIAKRLRSVAAEKGVEPQRLIFGQKRPRDEYLDQLRLADLMLDTFPYTAHTTGSDALWMGCPLITQPGNTFASRVAASLLKGCGLDELIVASPQDLTQATIALIRDRKRLRDLRVYLESNRHTLELFDTALVTRQVEQAFQCMMQWRRQGKAPESFETHA